MPIFYQLLADVTFLKPLLGRSLITIVERLSRANLENRPYNVNGSGGSAFIFHENRIVSASWSSLTSHSRLVLHPSLWIQSAMYEGNTLPVPCRIFSAEFRSGNCNLQFVTRKRELKIPKFDDEKYPE